MKAPGAGTASSRLLAGFFLALLVAAAFWPVVSGRRHFFHLDLRYEHLPVWDVTQKALLAGDSPFWIDGEYLGHPLLFHQEAPIFYPLTVPLLMTGAPVARLADLFSLFHFWLAGFSAYLLLEELRTTRLSSLFGGVGWMLSARVLQSAIWPNAVAASALLPVLLLGVARIAGGARRTSGVLLAAASGGLLLLAARPHVVVAASPVLVMVTAVWLAKSRSRKRALSDLALAAILSVALGAPALFPSAALYPEMSRASGLTRLQRDVNPIRLSSGLDMVFLPVDGGSRWPEAAAYPGVAAGILFLAGVALVARRDRRFPAGVFLALLAGGIVGLVFAFGEAGPYRLIADWPLLRGFRVPARYLVSWSFAIAIGSALVLCRLAGGIRRPILAEGAAVALLSADLGWHAIRAAPTSPAAVDSVEPEIVEPLKACVGRDEVGFPRRFWTLAAPFHLTAFRGSEQESVARGSEPLFEALGMRFGLESVSGGGPALMRTERLLARPGERPAALAGAGCLVTSRPFEGRVFPPGWVIRSAPALPRALLVTRAVPSWGAQAVAATLAPAFDPRREAIVEDAEPLAPERAGETPGDVRLLSRRPGHVELAAIAMGERVLVLFDAWERGWRARVDRTEAPVFRADGAFRGVRIPSGTHRVIFEYTPPGLREGIGVFAAGLLGLALFVIRARRPHA